MRLRVPIARRSSRAAAAVLLATGLAGAATGGTGPAEAAAAPSSGCAQVQIVAVRGTTEPGQVGGTLQGLASRITRDTPRTVLTYGLPYPASDDFVPSVNSGVALLAKRLGDSAKACPAQRFVLLGYSQGAWVIGDALAGGGGGVAPRIGAVLGRRVAAVVFYGDPRLVAGEPFLADSRAAGVSGVIPRDKGALAAYASRIRSYCDDDDTICQSGATGQGHFDPRTKTMAAAAFVLAGLRRPAEAVPAAPAAAGPTVSAAEAAAAASRAFAASAAQTPATTAAAEADPSRPGRGSAHRSWWRLLISWNKVAFSFAEARGWLLSPLMRTPRFGDHLDGRLS